MSILKFVMIFLAVLLGLFILKAIFIAFTVFFILLKFMAIAGLIATFIFIGYKFKHKQ